MIEKFRMSFGSVGMRSENVVSAGRGGRPVELGYLHRRLPDVRALPALLAFFGRRLGFGQGELAG